MALAEQAWGQAALFALKIALASVAGWFCPTGLAIDHGWSWMIGAREGLLLVMGGIGVALATWRVFRFDHRMGWCVIWFWVALLPLAALPVVSRLTLYQDHRVYLGGVGLAWLFGRVAVTGANALRPFRAIRVAAWLGAGAVIAAALVADTARTAVWSDADRLWDDVIEQYPGSILGANHVGLRYLSADELDRAREIFERSASTEPRFPMTHNYLGIVYAKLGQRDRAIAEFETAVRLNPYYATARLNLGNAYEQSQRPDLALDAYERGLPDGPWAVATLQRSARLLERQGRFDEARERYRRILDAERNAEGRK
jgi:tetratricopeptide (TPR) repeat protein